MCIMWTTVLAPRGSNARVWSCAMVPMLTLLTAVLGDGRVEWLEHPRAKDAREMCDTAFRLTADAK